MKRIWPGILAAAVWTADRITKVLAPGIPEEGQLLSGVPWLPGLLSLAAVIGGFLLLRKKKIHPLAMTGLMMMLGGALGNMVDRFFLGYVPDMIEVLFMEFAIFNVADAFLCVGCALVILRLLLEKDPAE